MFAAFATKPIGHKIKMITYEEILSLKQVLQTTQPVLAIILFYPILIHKLKLGERIL